VVDCDAEEPDWHAGGLCKRLGAPAPPHAPILRAFKAGNKTALEEGETQIDAVIGKTGLAASVVAAQLMRMELKRLVRQLPGRVYVRVGG
jgi:DNA processing protein